MANGIEDLREKNENRVDLPSKNQSAQFTQWRNFQGREDAEMLLEKSTHLTTKKERPSRI